MHYKYDLYGRFDGTSENPSERTTEIPPQELSQDYNWNGIDWVYAPEIITTPVVISEQKQEQDFNITRLAFRNRFTQEEKVKIELAQLDDPSTSLEQRAMSAALRASQADVNNSTFIDLSRADTRQGVMHLELMNILAEGRAEEILDSPITEIERFKG